MDARMEARLEARIEARRVENLAVGVNPAHASKSAVLPQIGKSFNDALARAVDSDSGLRFSKHATARLNSRQVDLTPEQLRRVEEGVNAAWSKGVLDSLVLVDGYALVVNTRSMTVVTAMDSSQNGGVFTNISGAVIV